jgi:thiamine-phosphate pyrophosphorylase
VLLCYITPGASEARLAEALTAGLDYVQIRDKELPGRELFERCRKAGSLPRTARLLVNDRLDMALACGLDGVHLPADRPPPERYRAASERPLVIGVSCHTSEEVRRAAGEGADFVVLGPVYASPGKGPPVGLRALEQAARESVPVLALGGITLENAPACLQAGAAGIAAIRLFEEAASVAGTVMALRSLGERR